MAIDHAAREAKLKRREAALARAHAHHIQKQFTKHPHSGFYYDINKGARRNGPRSLPASNSLLRDVLLWKRSRNAKRKPSFEGQFHLRMSGQQNGQELEMDDNKLVALATIKKEDKEAKAREAKKYKPGKDMDGHGYGNSRERKLGEDEDAEDDLQCQWDVFEKLKTH